MKYKFSRIWCIEHTIDIEADSYEEANNLARENKDWKEDEESSFINVERWKREDDDKWNVTYKLEDDIDWENDE